MIDLMKQMFSADLLVQLARLNELSFPEGSRWRKRITSFKFSFINNGNFYFKVISVHAVYIYI